MNNSTTTKACISKLNLDKLLEGLQYWNDTNITHKLEIELINNKVITTRIVPL